MAARPSVGSAARVARHVDRGPRRFWRAGLPATIPGPPGGASASEPDGLAVGAEVASGAPAILDGVDRLAPAEADAAVLGSLHPVAPLGEDLVDRGIEAGLEADVQAAHPLESRGIERRLGVLAEVPDPAEYLQVTLRLHEAAHDAEGHEPIGRRGGRDRWGSPWRE